MLLANLVLAALLSGSGLLLLVVYTPGSVLAAVHRQAGLALLVVAALWLLLLLASPPRPARLAIAVGVLAGAAVALGTGPPVAWRQLAVWAVAVEAGRSFRGYLWLLGDGVRFAVVGRAELEPATVVVLLVVHLGVGVATVLAALGGLAAGRRRVSR